MTTSPTDTIGVPAPRTTRDAERHPLVAGLLDDLDALPGQQAVLLRIAQLSDDEDCSLSALADVCAADPPYAARLLSLANSSYYGRRGVVTSLSGGINVIGREAVRCLALTTALGMNGARSTVPAAFWSRAALTASASQLVARALGAPAGDAFCGGLLADVGQALLLTAAGDSYPALMAQRCGPELLALEHEAYGIGHAELGALAMSRVGLPDVLCEAIGAHHTAGLEDASGVSALARSVHAGSILAHAVDAGELAGPALAELVLITDGSLSEADGSRILLESAAAAAALAVALM